MPSDPRAMFRARNRRKGKRSRVTGFSLWWEQERRESGSRNLRVQG